MSKIVSHEMYMNKQTLPTSLGHSSNILDTPIPPSGPSLRAVTSWTMDPHYFLYLPFLYTSPTPPNTPSSPDAPTQAATTTPLATPTPSGTPTLIATPTPFASPTPFATPTSSGHPTSPTRSSFPFWPTWPTMQDKPTILPLTSTTSVFQQ